MILFLIIVLSVVMVLDCTLLVFLVLMQLPKKEAGAGLAFGGAATDALFGAGSGNFLTKATKYAAGLFFALAILLSIMQSWKAHQPGSDFLERVKQHQNEQSVIAPPPAATTPPPAQSLTAPTTNLMVIPSAESMPATVATNAATSNAAPAASAPK
jgi:preprotein translocase subunit SecG